MATLPYATFDADNHYYEPPDCFTRHMPADRRHLAFQLAEVEGRRQPVVDGRPVTVLSPDGFFGEEAALPGSFAHAAGTPFTSQRAIYFSFVTQATLGYGDIVPLGDEAQGVAVVQAVGGQIYLAVLVARLVSLYSARETR